MLTVTHGLDSRALTAIAALEREVVAADGGRLKLEWGVLERRTTFDVDLLWWDGDRLLGFLGVYAFGPPDVELAGMVAPAARRRGVGTALLESARPLLRARGYERLLLVTPTVAAPSSAGRAFAQRQGAELDHSEHFLVLGATPGGADRNPAVVLRVAREQDRGDVRRLLKGAFGGDPQVDVLHRHGDTTYVAELAGVAVGTVRLSLHGTSEGHPATGAVYGFGVDPAYQGRGIGRDVLERCCRLLRAQGCARLTLEVETANDTALGLYLSTGFVKEAGEDYWALVP